MSVKSQKGIVAIIPVLVVAGILLLSFVLGSSKKQNSISGKTAVLSESGTSGSDSGSHSGDSGSSGGSTSGSSGGSGSSSGGSTSGSSGGSGGSGIFHDSPGGSTFVTMTRTPEPSEKPERIETPEPSETPEAEVETEVEAEVKEGTLSAKIKIRSGKNETHFEQEGTDVRVENNFPLSVNPTTDQLTVATPGGAKTVAVLPDTAVTELLGAGTVNQINTDNFGKKAVTLATDANGNLVYVIDGVKFEKLLGLINVGISKTAQVSVANGQITGVNQSIFSQMLDLLSF